MFESLKKAWLQSQIIEINQEQVVKFVFKIIMLTEIIHQFTKKKNIVRKTKFFDLVIFQIL
jgi:hypothetical protein